MCDEDKKIKQFLISLIFNFQVDSPSLPQSEELIHAQLLKQGAKIDRLLTLGQINLAIQESDVLLLVLKLSKDRVNETLHKQVGVNECTYEVP